MSKLENQLRSVIQWDNPQPYEIFLKFTDRGDEIKNASKLILQPGQGCIFTNEGQIEDVFDEEGTYDLKTSNKPFITTLKNIMYAFDSPHIIGLWFYRKAQIPNIRWGTSVPITYKDPVYSFPVNLMGYGNFTIQITNPKSFFTNIVAGKEFYYASSLQELMLSRISQTISNFLANAKFSYTDVDSKLAEIAAISKAETTAEFNTLGFNLVDFKIEGTSFDDETNRRIGGISDMQADALAAKLTGVDFTEFQKLKAMRDAANNQGTTGAAMGMFAGMNLGSGMVNNQQSTPTSQQATGSTTDTRTKLKELKELFEDGLIDDAEYKAKKEELLKNL